jgi:hypothetical protein
MPIPLRQVLTQEAHQRSEKAVRSSRLVR